MKQETLKQSADFLVILTVSTGAGSEALRYLEYINTYAAGLGVLISFFGLIAAAVFYFATWKRQGLAGENKKELDEHKKHTDERFNEVGDGIQEILSKMDKGK